MIKHPEKIYLEILMDLDVFRPPKFGSGFWNAVCMLLCMYIFMRTLVAPKPLDETHSYSVPTDYEKRGPSNGSHKTKLMFSRKQL
jgi:hypothetical protein